MLQVLQQSNLFWNLTHKVISTKFKINKGCHVSYCCRDWTLQRGCWQDHKFELFQPWRNILGKLPEVEALVFVEVKHLKIGKVSYWDGGSYPQNGSLTNRVFLKISRVKIREWSSLIHVFHANSSSKTKQLTRLLGELPMNPLLLKRSTRNFGK